MCTGNVRRSPLVEVLLRLRLDARRVPRAPGFGISSAGTHALAGYAMDDRAAAAARERGADPSSFVARRLTTDMVAEADLVLAVTRAHRGEVARLYPRALQYTLALGDFAQLVSGLDPGDGAAGQPSRDGLRALVRRVASRRGARPPLEVDAVDVVDPFGRDDATYQRMVSQVDAALPAVVDALIGSAGSTPGSGTGQPDR